MSLAVTELNNVKVYNLCAGKTKNQFLEEAFKNKKSLRKNEDYRQRIELLQDFEFPTASSRVRVSGDLQYIAAVGVYPPQVRIYDTSEVSMKCQRGLDAEVVQFHFLTEDYRKLIYLCDNRSVELHAQYGKHYSTRIPRFGRDLVYNPFSCETYIVGATNEVYRLSLDQGRFLASLESNICETNNVVAWSRALQWLVVTGGSEAVSEFWDMRSRSPVMQLRAASELTAVQFDEEGLTFATGVDSGIVQLYDLRFPEPYATITHLYQLPIKALKFHPGKTLFSADSKLIKVSHKLNGSLLTGIESEEDLNDIELYGDSGMVLAAMERSRVGAFYIPAVGLVPKWCGFLESLTEELEEQKRPRVYEDFQFVTHEELKNLDALHLVGTEKLQAYMHGYFMDVSLYYQLKSASQTFTMEEYRKTRIREKLEAKRAERITVKAPAPPVNKELAKEMHAERTLGEGKKKAVAESLLGDERFGALFQDKDFEIDKTAVDYKRLNSRPSTKTYVLESEEEALSETESAPIVAVQKLRRKKRVEIEEEVSDPEAEFTFRQRLTQEEAPVRPKRRRDREQSERRTAVSTDSLLKRR